MLTGSILAVLLVGIGSILLDRNRIGKPQAEALRLLVAGSFPVTQNIHISFENTGLRFPDLVPAAQLQLDHILQQKGILSRYALVDDLAQTFDPFLTARAPEPGPMLITVDAGGSAPATTATNATETDASTHKKRDKPLYGVSLALSDSVSIYHDIYANKVIMGYDLNAVHKNDMPFFVAQAVIDHLLAVDFSTAEKIRNTPFSNYASRLDVNFVAAEELGNTPTEIVTAIEDHFANIIERLNPLVELTIRCISVDVTKTRLRPANTKNSTNVLNFVYLTSLLGFADVIQGVPIRHLETETVQDLKENQVLHGTELLKRQQQVGCSTYNITSFVDDAASAIFAAAGLPLVESENLAMRAESAMKYYALTGIVEELDRITDNFSEGAFLRVAKLVDHILVQEEHDWHEYLLQVSEWHRRE